MSPAWRNETQAVPRALRILLGSCPAEIKAYAFIVEGAESRGTDTSATTMPAEKWQRSVYQQCTGGRWVKAECGQTWKTILPPAKRFDGAVGEYYKIRHGYSMVDLQEDGLWLLIVESLRRHELEVRRVEGIFCLAEGCGGYFKRGEEWLMHVAEWHQQEWMSGERFRMLPGGIREEFERQGKRLEKQREELGQETRKRLDEWREGGEEKQEEMRARWAKQLEFDTGWEIEDEEVRNRVWNDYWQLMDGQV
jgi:hypothetical protein